MVVLKYRYRYLTKYSIIIFIRHIHLLYLCLFDREVQFSFFILIKLFVRDIMIRILSTGSYLFLSHFKYICVKLACIW